MYILGEMSLAREFIRMDIKSGQTVRFWTDIWHPKGSLIDITGEIDTQKLRIPRNAKICEVHVDGFWQIRRCRDRRIQVLMQEVWDFPISHSVDVMDGVLWRKGPDDYGDGFLSDATWQHIRQQKQKIQWTKLIWFLQGVPRFAFISLLAFRDSLATGHRTGVWGQPQGCLFCGEPEDTHDHLFLLIRTLSRYGCKS